MRSFLAGVLTWIAKRWLVEGAEDYLYQAARLREAQIDRELRNIQGFCEYLPKRIGRGDKDTSA